MLTKLLLNLHPTKGQLGDQEVGFTEAVHNLYQAQVRFNIRQ